MLPLSNAPTYTTLNNTDVSSSFMNRRKQHPSSFSSSQSHTTPAASQRQYQKQQQGDVVVVVHSHDVLSGRGVNISQHPGNQRFRTLVTTRADETYCTDYSSSEKRAVAEEIIRHIQGLDPPGRFLRRESGRHHSNRGLSGPWTVMSQREAVKKTCQALRDCNRQDREGYACGVAMPEDVRVKADERAQLGLTVKEQAEVAAAAMKANTEALIAAAVVQAATKRQRRHLEEEVVVDDQQQQQQEQDRISPSVENAAEWLKKQRTDDISWPTRSTSAIAAVSDFAAASSSSSAGVVYQDETTTTTTAAPPPSAEDVVVDSSSGYASTNDLFAPVPSTEDEVVEETTVGESDYVGGYGYRMSFNPYVQFPSLSAAASEEAVVARPSGGGGFNMNNSGYTTSSSTGGINMGGATSSRTNMNAGTSYNSNSPSGSLNMSTAGGLNMNNMNEL